MILYKEEDNFYSYLLGNKKLVYLHSEVMSVKVMQTDD